MSPCKSRAGPPFCQPRARVPDIVGARLPRPYHFPARIQSFQAVAAPFPGGLRCCREVLSRRDPGDRKGGCEPCYFASFLRHGFPRWRAPGGGRAGLVRVSLRAKRRGRKFSRFVSFQCFAARKISATRGERCRDPIRCGGAELVRVGGVHYLASRGETRGKFPHFVNFQCLAGRKISAPQGREKAATRRARRSRRSRRSAALARNRNVRPSARWSIARRRDGMREDGRSTTTRRDAGCQFRGASARRAGFGTLGHFGFLDLRRAMKNPSTNHDSQKEKLHKI